MKVGLQFSIMVNDALINMREICTENHMAGTQIIVDYCLTDEIKNDDTTLLWKISCRLYSFSPTLDCLSAHHMQTQAELVRATVYVAQQCSQWY